MKLEKDELKAAIKESMLEVFEQKKDDFIQLFGEILEDRLFLQAIKDGEESGLVSRDEVFAELES